MRFPANDGSDDVLQGALNSPLHPRNKPLIVLIHGLTGSEDSTHIVEAAAFFLSRGHAVLRLNQRGAGPSRNTCKGHYHAGRCEDLAGVLSQLPNDMIAAGICLLAVSLGANMMLKFLEDYPRFPIVRAAVAVCPPVDLRAAQQRIMAPRNWVYHRYLLNHMKFGVQQAEINMVNGGKFLQGLPSIYAFDDQIVAPANGFANALDYYQKCSTADAMEAIDTPTLIIHSADDPWVPIDPLLKRIANGSPSPLLSVICPSQGGHVGCHGQGTTVPWYNLCAEVFFNRA
jgi:predicted alpha/beta-fold hydrolase